jgi:hypothetical protein
MYQENIALLILSQDKKEFFLEAVGIDKVVFFFRSVALS